uniref:Cyclic nucleotide-binding domain-containing protein n=1 Tax=Noctiluca scintillans TaxID=2966 RepID=A0A7S1FCN9_NOCSC|mmetsp:Transcript_50371/g.133776  ORF Transcript_50371/g.133776 Transcript_50371/m.133776 type:complete len:490 (+) Transcript_50371:91-1560(+)
MMASTPAHGSNQEAAKDTSRRFKTFQSMHFQGAFGNVCVSKHPIFQGRDPNFIEMLISEFMIELYAEGDVILKQGALGDSMYFLNRGSVEVLTSRMEQVSVLKEGSVFGEMSCLGSASRRTCTVRALEFCDCRSIARWSFRSLLKRFPEEQLFFTKLCDERYKKLNEVKERRRPRATVEFAMLCQEPSVCGYRSVLPLGGGTERGAVTSSCVHGELPLRGSLSGVTEPSRRGRSEAHTERSRRGRSEAQTEPSLRGRSEAQFQRPDSVSGSSGSDTSQASDQSWKYETRRTGSLRSRRHDCVQDSPIDGRPAGCVSETAEATDGHRSSSWDCERSSSDVAKADGYQSSWRARAHSAEASRLKLMLKSVTEVYTRSPEGHSQRKRRTRALASGRTFGSLEELSPGSDSISAAQERTSQADRRCLPPRPGRQRPFPFGGHAPRQHAERACSLGAAGAQIADLSRSVLGNRKVAPVLSQRRAASSRPASAAS